MKDMEITPELKEFFKIASKDFEERQAETKARIAHVRGEMDKWRHPEKLKVTLSVYANPCSQMT